MALLFSITILIDNAFAQNFKSESVTVGWNNIATIVASTGVVSGVVSGLFSRYVTLKQVGINHENTMKQLKFNHDATMKELKEQRRVQVMQDTLNVYASFIFHLKKLNMSISGVNTGMKPPKDIEDSVHEIDVVLKDKFYLLSPKVVDKWLLVSDNYKDMSKVEVLRQELSNEYNSEIIPRYNSIIGADLKPLLD